MTHDDFLAGANARLRHRACPALTQHPNPLLTAASTLGPSISLVGQFAGAVLECLFDLRCNKRT